MSQWLPCLQPSELWQSCSILLDLVIVCREGACMHTMCDIYGVFHRYNTYEKKLI